jgi:hypothetical protein
MRVTAQEESCMRFYNRQHRHDCGIDRHVKTMYVCILDATGRVLVHRNVKSNAEMKAIHGGKATNDKIDSHKIAALLRGGLLPQA